MFFFNRFKTTSIFLTYVALIFSQNTFAVPNHPNEQGGADIIIRENVKKRPNGVPVNGETPASVACIYGFTKAVAGCPINGTTLLPTGGQGITIAVTEGGDDPNAYQELTTFSAMFNLPQLPLCTSGGPIPCFSAAYVGGVVPPPPASKTDLSEHALDIEWAHAMAPQASIIMVEGPSFSNITDMLDTVALASQLVFNAGGGIVSNSWSFTESPSETTYDSFFINTPKVIYIASSGDYAAPATAPARYPSSSPYVISAGGTSIQRDVSGNFMGEVAWRNASLPIGTKLSGGSGGPSLYEPRPFYQNSVAKIVGQSRGTPDISIIADPRTGVDLFRINNDTGPEGEWVISGGTSLAAPLLAGVIASANSGATSTSQELSIIYTGALKHYHEYWHDILQGNNGFPCLAGYDFATGLGSPLGYKGK